MIPDTTFQALPSSEITHRLVRPGVVYQVNDFVDDGYEGGAFTAIGMIASKAHLGAWTLVSLEGNGIESKIVISSCDGDEVTPTNSACCFVYA